MALESGAVPMKRRLIAALEELPDDATFDDALERLHLVYKVQAGIEQAEQGMLIPHRQVMDRMRPWLR
ncbi:MAG TPA: hypothetical protein VFA70_06570 [Dehalococcoidia bacterium]|nr:hypothetical protein [Dehalococcoidia bacterium]